MFTTSSRGICTDLIESIKSVYSEHIIPLVCLTEVILSYKDYTKAGLPFYMLLVLLGLILHLGNFLTTVILTVGFTIISLGSIVVITFFSGIYVLIKPLTSRISWSKLKFKIKK